MGGSGVGLDSGGGSRGASLGGRGMRAMFNPSSIHHKSKSLLGPGGCERCAPLGPRASFTVSLGRRVDLLASPGGNVGSSLAQPQVAPRAGYAASALAAQHPRANSEWLGPA
jgi:hypothetical protein